MFVHGSHFMCRSCHWCKFYGSSGACVILGLKFAEAFHCCCLLGRWAKHNFCFLNKLSGYEKRTWTRLRKWKYPIRLNKLWGVEFWLSSYVRGLESKSSIQLVLMEEDWRSQRWRKVGHMWTTYSIRLSGLKTANVWAFQASPVGQMLQVNGLFSMGFTNHYWGSLSIIINYLIIYLINIYSEDN